MSAAGRESAKTAKHSDVVVSMLLIETASNSNWRESPPKPSNTTKGGRGEAGGVDAAASSTQNRLSSPGRSTTAPECRYRVATCATATVVVAVG